MTYGSTLETIHAEAQQEVFARHENAGRSFPVVFSHILFFTTTYSKEERSQSQSVPVRRAPIRGACVRPDFQINKDARGVMDDARIRKSSSFVP